jgi:hypothetical protein
MALDVSGLMTRSSD